MAKKAVFNDIEAALKQKRFQPIYFFFGREDFLIEELVRIIKAEAFHSAEDSNLNFTLLYGEEQTLGDVVSVASEYPMFSERRLVVVKSFDKLKKDRSREKQKAQTALFTEYLKNPLPSTILVLTTGKLDKATLSKEPFPLLQSFSYEFDQIQDAGRFAEERAKRYGWTLSPQAIKILVTFAGNSARELDAEIQKLSLFADGKSGEKILTDAEVLQTVGLSREYNVFELDKAIVAGDLRMASGIALMILEHEGEKTGLFAILNYLIMFFTRLWKLKMPAVQRMTHADIAKELGMYGSQAYFLKDYLSYTGRFSVLQIENALIALHEADLALKGILPIQDEKLLILSLMRKILT
ncbi:DNA polymerase III, delta subunit [Chloroherpeton thalassium ATCC 35110]|uniref:DNA polymerase III subunit delta n=1 Tax=Chloroherpeton thalassium (strain ATCC 35110 / GB-78) TaxID=517418 RepID=B3QUL8_CHLT3|nr:DNA polymerase III, delta subunit [Chloroherpeton thalassium ATCC 35110]